MLIFFQTEKKEHLEQIFIHHEDSILSLARKSSPLADKFGESWGDFEPPTFFLSQPDRFFFLVEAAFSTGTSELDGPFVAPFIF